MRKLMLPLFGAWATASLAGGAYSRAKFPDDGELQVNPTFVNCSVEYGASKPMPGLRLEYRESDDATWLAVPDEEFRHYPVSRGYRTSIRDLEEDREYVFRLVTNSGSVVTSSSFRTWRSDVPIARTVYLDAHGPKVISEKGTPDGWIRCTAKPGTTLDFGDGTAMPITIDGAEYVVLEDMVIRGCSARNIINLRNSRHVRLRNLDLSRWGRVGEVRFDKSGCIYPHHASDKEGYINYDAAIWIGKGAFGTVVERCYVHDPLGRAHSWYYSHPAGPEAVMMGNPEGSTVIRWNDFVGSDDHRFNDAVEGTDNFMDDGGFNRDADVYGNFMIYCNDDNIEMDGAQRNVRNFDNRYESALCGVSIQGCEVGPTYVYRNAFTGMGEEFGAAGQIVKTGGGPHGPEARAFLADNLFWGHGELVFRPDLEAICSGNTFTFRGISQKSASALSVDEGNRFSANIAEDELDPNMPVRPLGFSLDRARFSGFRVEGGVVSPEVFTLTAKGGARDVPCKIVKNEVFDWFEVSPSEFVVPAGKEVELAVRVKPERTGGRRHWRGAFLVRAEDGLSRPFSLYAETDYVPPYRAEKICDTAVYSSDFKPGVFVRLPKLEQAKRIALEVPRTGRWYFMLHGRGVGSVWAGVDGDKPEKSRQQATGYSSWTILAPGRGFGNRCRHYDLEAGVHTVALANESGGFTCDGLVLTDNPLSFEPSPHSADWPAECDPSVVSRRITRQLLSTSPHDYRPRGFVGKQGYGWNRMIHYSVVSLWVNAIECASLRGDDEMKDKLLANYLDYLPGGRFHDKCSTPYHVDDAVFGALPLEVYLCTKDRRCLEQGLRYADIQFAPPCEGTIGERHALSASEQQRLYEMGCSPETRFWIDDMYMITALQSQAFRATGRREYIERAAREMCLYLDKLQIKDGADAGLFHHAPTAPFVWGRGAGWMAAGMTLVLSCLPEDSEYRPRIMKGYLLMMERLLANQRPSGLWGQLVNDPESWDETSGSAMYAYAFIVGTRRGWLAEIRYRIAAGRAWRALCGKLDANANMEDVCEGTGHENSRDWYMNRARQTGDPHGQAPMLWICRELLK